MDVLAIDIQKSSNFLISLSQDLTIRIWNIAKREQVYEFSFPQEDQCQTISAHPSKLYFAGGFKSGCLRIFDIEKMCISEELTFYVDEIQQVKYSPDGKLLMAVNGRGLYTIFDTERNYAVINQIEIDFPSEYQHLDFSKDGSLFAITGDHGNFIDVYNTSTKSKITKIKCKNTFVKNFKFSNCGNELFVATTS